MSNADVQTVLAWITWVLSAVSNLRYNFGRRSPWDSGHQDDVAFTPFTAAYIGIWLFWIALLLIQFFYLLRSFKVSSVELQNHFIINNVLLILWSYWFARGHYFLSEIAIILVFWNAAIAYLVTKSYLIRPIFSWFSIHLPVVALPLAWSTYAIFWNGAVLFHARNWPARIVANVVIWNFLFVPAFFLALTGDYAIGLAFAWLTFSLGWGQLSTKVFALQWIFAFVISGLDLLISAAYAVRNPNLDSVPLLGEIDAQPDAPQLP